MRSDPKGFSEVSAPLTAEFFLLGYLGNPLQFLFKR